MAEPIIETGESRPYASLGLLRRCFPGGAGGAAQGGVPPPPAVAQPWSRGERHRSSAAFVLTPQ
ncbi:hypothetical protein CLJ1_3174 [Pseudomonas paraeruginosa]|nr:hypothetical protein CLJ1_3174 [Pseudomonas aeruginosa]